MNLSSDNLYIFDDYFLRSVSILYTMRKLLLKILANVFPANLFKHNLIMIKCTYNKETENKEVSFHIDHLKDNQ